MIAFPRELSVGSTGNTCHAAKEPTYRSAVCGPSSLHGDRTEHDCECHASRSGFKKPGPHTTCTCELLALRFQDEHRVPRCSLRQGGRARLPSARSGGCLGSVSPWTCAAGLPPFGVRRLLLLDVLWSSQAHRRRRRRGHLPRPRRRQALRPRRHRRCLRRRRPTVAAAPPSPPSSLPPSPSPPPPSPPPSPPSPPAGLAVHVLLSALLPDQRRIPGCTQPTVTRTCSFCSLSVRPRGGNERTAPRRRGTASTRAIASQG